MNDSIEARPMGNGRQLPSAITSHSTQVQAIAAAEEVRTLFLAAMQCPRDTVSAKAEIIEACTDIDLAQEALYAYKRGGQLVEGPSIDLVTEIATIWGRIKNGWEVVEQADGKSKVRAYAIDLQTLHPVERQFWVAHIRDTGSGRKILTEERDIYEGIANLAQRRMRSCIEALIPKHIMNAAVRQVQETLKEAHKDPLEKRATKMAELMYKNLGITEKMLEKFLGGKILGMTETQYVRLIAVCKSIKDGAPVETFFDVVPEAKVTDVTPTKADKPADQPAAEAKPDKPKKPGKVKKDATDPKPAGTAQGSPDSTQAPEPPANTATDTEAPPELLTGEDDQEPPVGESDDWSNSFK